MQIPVFKKAVDNSSSSDIPSLKPPPSLAAVRINASRQRSLFYRSSYLAIALCLLLAFGPFVLERPIWACAAAASIYGLWVVYRKEMSGELIGSLGFNGERWVLEQAGESQLVLAGEVLCWSWLIIMPFKRPTDDKTLRLLLFSDSLSREDKSRLRAWLRACLVPKA